jgi:putative glutamine amidotransferase
MSGKATIPTIAVTLSGHAADSVEDCGGEQYCAALRQYQTQTVGVAPGQHGLELTAVDGLLLSGGGDIEPWRYGARDAGLGQGVDCTRDETELSLTRGALSAGLPVLGICRGAQVLGVAVGGQLVQDIGSELPGAQEHGLAGKGPGAGHWVEIAPGSRLAEIIGLRRIRVNSSHHQANSRLGVGVSRAAWCDDGVTEAIEADGAGFAIGVQWHPERMLKCESSRRLFAAFIDACRSACDRKHG